MSAELARVSRDKRTDILKAAQRVFLKEGYARTSMEAIARAAGVSKQTIYNHFRDKEGLFRAFAQARCEAMREALESGFDGGDNPARVLTLFGENILGVMLSRDAVRLKQLLQSEGLRYPQLAEVFYRFGSEQTTNRLARYLTEQKSKHTLTVQDPKLAAEQFIAMLAGHLRLRHLIGLAGPPSEAERKRYVTNAVTIFLNGVRKR